MVGVQQEGGGERSDVADERRVLEQRRGGRQEGQLAHFPVGRRGRRAVGVVGARFWRVVLLHPETNDLTETEKTNRLPVVYPLFLRSDAVGVLMVILLLKKGAV